jgi:hypothetical protein
VFPKITNGNFWLQCKEDLLLRSIKKTKNYVRKWCKFLNKAGCISKARSSGKRPAKMNEVGEAFVRRARKLTRQAARQLDLPQLPDGAKHSANSFEP